MTKNTLQVSNLSSKATIPEVEEFFSFSGQVENVDLHSNGKHPQVAYVTFADSDSLDAAMLLSGSTIIDQEVNISTVHDTDQEDPSPETEITPSSKRPFTKAQDMVTNMLSKGYLLGKDALKKAKSLDEKRRVRSRTTTATTEAAAAATNGSAMQARMASTMSKSRARLAEGYKQVLALNERLQIGQKAMAALATAQQGVASAGSAVAKNRYVAAGGTWMSGAIAKVGKLSGDGASATSSSSSASASASSSSSSAPEQVQLTEMSTLKSEA